MTDDGRPMTDAFIYAFKVANILLTNKFLNVNIICKLKRKVRKDFAKKRKVFFGFPLK